MISVDEYGKLYIIETSSKCEITDLDLAMNVIKASLDSYKKHCKQQNLPSKAWGNKRYNLNDDEIGTITKLRSELSWWLSNGYYLKEVSCNLNGIVMINLDTKRF